MNQRFTDMGPKKPIDTTCIRLKTGVGAKLLVTWDKKHDLRYKSGENSTISVEISTSDPHQCCQKHYSVRIFFISAQMSGNLAVLQESNAQTTPSSNCCIELNGKKLTVRLNFELTPAVTIRWFQRLTPKSKEKHTCIKGLIKQNPTGWDPRILI